MPPFTRCHTPTLRAGTAQPPPWRMPGYTLVKLDSGEMYWFLDSILREGEPPVVEKRGKKWKKAVKGEKVSA